MKKILVTGEIPQIGIDLLKFNNFDVRVFNEPHPIFKEELIKMAPELDGIVTLLRDKIDKDVVDALKKCKIIANYAVGYNNIDVDYARSKGIIVTNTPDILTETTAELAWALLFAIARRIVESDKFTREGKFNGWESKLFLGTDIYGKTLGVVGSGRIATAFAEKAKAFKMDILYYSRHRSEKFERATGGKYTDLDKLLSHSDFVSLHVPLNEESYHMIDERRLNLMKNTAFLINTARGAVIDEKALVRALNNGEIAGAGLDVFEFEPKITKDLKFMDNVILTPHIGSASTETRNAMSELVANNVINVLNGEKALTPVF